MRALSISLVCALVFIVTSTVLQGRSHIFNARDEALSEVVQPSQVPEKKRLPEITPTLEEKFRRALIRRSNQFRKVGGVTDQISIDAELQRELKRLMSQNRELSQERLTNLLEQLNDRFPSAHALAAQVEIRETDKALGTALSNWPEAHSADFNALSIYLFDAGKKRGGLMVLSRRLPEFSTASYGGDYSGPYHQKCSLCSTSYATQLQHAEGAGYLACPSCREVFAIVVGTPDGRVRHASEFFEGFAFPLFSARSDQYGTLLEVWRRVLEEVAYKLDEDSYEGALDVWKSPSETWEDHGGDCEDTSILLCDALISAGIDARVAVGLSTTEGEPQGHAWVVAKIGHQQYLLESTGDPHLLRQPLRVEKEAGDYQPIYQFDPASIYMTRGGEPADCDDYWSSDRWAARKMDRSPEKIVSAARP